MHRTHLKFIPDFHAANRRRRGPLPMLRRLMRSSRLVILVSALIALFLVGGMTALSVSPAGFPRGSIVRIPTDMTVGQAADLLADKGIVRSPFMYKAYVVLLHDGKGIQAGSYLFDEPQSALRVAYRMAYGKSDLHKIKVTIPEGSSSNEIATIIKRAIPDFDTESFISEARKAEGYLFPETYFFDPDVSPTEIVSAMKGQFDEKVGEIMGEIASSTHALKDILVMASILEEEANNSEDRRMISGVLWKRIEIDMPLQVDAPFYYLFGKGSSQLTRDDLATSSPYNTYKNKGLPIGPISNPGIDAIRAALYPEIGEYLYYLADRTGVTHYAATHDEHVANKAKYLQ